MLSIIICSRKKKLADNFIKNIKATVGVEYEIIPIDNSENRYSIFSAYNLGLSLSNYPNLCFVHEDVIFHSNNWGQALVSHLQKPNTGILGLAGGDIATKVPSCWAAYKPSVNIIQSDYTGQRPSTHIIKRAIENSRSVVLLDGVFLCMKREVFEKIKFDENLDGFHGYDFDICIQSILAGYQNYVIYDIIVEHMSHGQMDKVYYQHLIKVYKKWENFLPIVEHNIPIENRKDILAIIEKKRLYLLIKRLVRSGFPSKEIAETISYYTKKVGSKTSIRLLVFLGLRIHLIRITSRIRNKK